MSNENDVKVLEALDSKAEKQIEKENQIRNSWKNGSKKGGNKSKDTADGKDNKGVQKEEKKPEKPKEKPEEKPKEEVKPLPAIAGADDPAVFSKYADEMSRQSDALSAAAKNMSPKMKKISGKDIGEEVTEEHAKKVLSNKELGGRRRTVIVRTKVVDKNGKAVAQEEPAEEKQNDAPKAAPKAENLHPPKETPQPAKKLILIRESTGEAYDLDRDLTIGRELDNDIVIPNPEGHYVSAHHAHIQIQGKDIFLKDLASTNGTYVNDRKVGSWRLKAGNKVEFADIVFRVESK